MAQPAMPAIRPIGGGGNNLAHPELNATPGTAERRLGPNLRGADFVAGPNARTISNVVSGGPEAQTADAARSAWLYVMGQFVDHDLDLETVDGSHVADIAVPPGDPSIVATSIPMGGRAVVDANGNIVNTVAGYLDLSQLYGSTAAVAASLRNADGTLKTSAGNALPIVNGQFLSGDVRVNENPELVGITTLFMREHNAQVAALAKVHPNWSGDQLYDMAKAITTAEYQRIIYAEYLPALVGAGSVPGYHGYDPTVSAQVSAEFATSAFRVGHSQVSGDQEGIDNAGEETFNQSLADAFFNTPQQTLANGLDGMFRSLSSDLSRETDIYAVDELRNLLAAAPQAIDLIAIDIQRERDVGVGSLNQTRAALSLTPYTAFSQISADPAVQARLAAVFPTVNDVDLFIGGLAEAHVNGGAVGETFNRIISQQFDALQTGDRFFWQAQGFDPVTAAKIGATTLSDIIQRNSDTTVLQQSSFLAAERHMSDEAAENPNGAQLVIGVDQAGAVIAGGPGDDTIVTGNALGQVLTGNGGADVFVFLYAGPHQTQATVSDFGADDRLDLSAIKGGMVTVTDVAGGALLKMPGNNQVLLAGMRADALTAANYAPMDDGSPVKWTVTHAGNSGT